MSVWFYLCNYFSHTIYVFLLDVLNQTLKLKSPLEEDLGRSVIQEGAGLVCN